MGTQLAQKEKLRKQIAALETKRSEMERGLAQVRGYLNAATSRRAELVSELAVADAATAAWAEGEIDNLDRAMTGHRRFIESHEAQLAKIAGDLAPLSSELEQVETSIRQQETDKAFAAWQSRITQGFASASELLANARVCLAEINKLALLGEHEFSARASALLAQKFDEFKIAEANPNQHGFQDARPLYQDTTVHVRPMTRA